MRRTAKILPLTLLCGAALIACPPAKEKPKVGSKSGTTSSPSAPKDPSKHPKSPTPPEKNNHGVSSSPKAAGSVKTPKKAFAQLAAAVPKGSYWFMSSPRIRKIASTFPPKEQRPVAAPLSLTASDGTGLELLSMHVKAVLEGPLAFTELHLVFKNPRPQTIEGRFAITLPSKAAISRLAMKLPQGWMEAEVVERQRARQIYEDFLHQRQDPALLEKKAGNEFSARIFPIPANGKKEIKISFSQELKSAKTPYRLPLLGLPRMRDLSITAFLSRAEKTAATTSLGGTTLTQQMVKIDKHDYKPDRDFVVAPPPGAPAALRKNNLAVARIAPKLSATDAPIKGLLVMVDTSASRAAGFASQVERLGSLLRALRATQDASAPLTLAAFDQTLGVIYQGTLGGLTSKHLEMLLARRALGASDLYGALHWAASVKGLDRLLLVTDAVATAGQTDGGALREAVKKLRGHFSRLDLLLVGGIRDEALAAKLARGNLAADGVVLDGATDATVLASRLTKTTLSGVEVSVPGAKWVWPSRLDGLQPGDEVLVYADLSPAAARAKAPITVKLSGPLTSAYEIPWATAPGPLLERAWVRARIARLAAQRDALGTGDRDLRAAIDKQIISLSTTHRVLCDKTALLVLQSEYDYRRYGIDRSALADILTIGAGGIEVKNRTRPVLLPGAVNKRKGTLAGGAPRPNLDRVASSPRRPRTRHRRPPRGRRSPPLESAMASGDRPVAAAPRRRRSRPSKASRGSRSDVPLASVRPRPKPSQKTRRPRPDRRRARPGRQRRASESLRRPRRTRRPPRRRLPHLPLRRPPRPAFHRRTPAISPWTGRFAAVMTTLDRGRVDAAIEKAMAWRREKPGDILALVALGEALAKAGQIHLAARAYGSIIDLYPSRADLRRFAGERLETLGKIGLPLAADTYAEALKQRPDHPNSHRMLAWALVRLGRYEDAFVTISKGLRRHYPRGRFRGVPKIMREDQGLIAAAWLAAEPKRRDSIEKMLAIAGAHIDKRPSLRFILSWETDSNDVDFHIRDARGGHAYYSHKHLPSGGSLYADVTTGYGPECFTIFGHPRAFPYHLQIHYYRRGPMGYGMGRLQIIQHDGRGGLRFAFRSYIVMRDRAYVDLGKIKRPL